MGLGFYDFFKLKFSKIQLLKKMFNLKNFPEGTLFFCKEILKNLFLISKKKTMMRENSGIFIKKRGKNIKELKKNSDIWKNRQKKINFFYFYLASKKCFKSSED